MREKHTDSVQNRFTAYLMAAVGNTRKKYWERKCRLQGREFIREDNLERNYTDFEEQYRAYHRGEYGFYLQGLAEVRRAAGTFGERPAGKSHKQAEGQGQGDPVCQGLRGAYLYGTGGAVPYGAETGRDGILLCAQEA